LSSFLGKPSEASGKYNSHFISKLEGHTSKVTAVTTFSDPSNLATPLAITGSADNTVRIWDMNTSECIHTLTRHHNVITGIVVCPAYAEHAARVFTSSMDGSIKIWELWTGNYVGSLDGGHSKGVRAICLYYPDTAALELPPPSQPAKRLSQANFLSVGNITSLKTYHIEDTLRLPLLVSTGDDCTILVWNIESSQVEFEPIPTGRTNIIHTLAVYSPIRDSKPISELPNIRKGRPIIIGAGSDKVIAFWDLISGDPLLIFDDKHKPLQGHVKTINSLAVYSPLDGASPFIVSGSSDRSVMVWDLYSGELMRTMEGHTDKVCCVQVYGAHEDKNPFVISCSEGKCVSLILSIFH
jgi:WD40 repeat protein